MHTDSTYREPTDSERVNHPISRPASGNLRPILNREILKPLLLVVWLIVLVTVPQALAQQTAPRSSTAELPLYEVLRLYQESSKQVDRPQPPPLRASLNQVELQGRLLDRAVELNGRIEVVVLPGEGWVTVPLLRVGATTNLAQLPAVENGMLAVVDDHLALITRTAGTFALELALLERASLQGSRRKAVVEVAAATLARLTLQHDRSLFRLAAPEVRTGAEGTVLFPVDGSFVLEWERRPSPPTRVRQVQQEAAVPAESVITSAHAHVVSTLGGQRIWRLLYSLRLQGEQPLTCTIPTGLSLKKVFRNGVSAPLVSEDTSHELLLSPARQGDEHGTLELVLNDSTGVFGLSGELSLTFPTVSWPVHEMTATLFLPESFNYTWVGGSMEPVAERPEVSFSYAVPTPGKELSFHQYLVSAAPAIAVDYTIDLAGQFFRP
jgi:hypothetical protein